MQLPLRPLLVDNFTSCCIEQNHRKLNNLHTRDVLLVNLMRPYATSWLHLLFERAIGLKQRAKLKCFFGGVNKKNKVCNVRKWFQSPEVEII